MEWWLAQNAVGALVLAVGVEVIIRVTRPRPSTTHALWLIVLFKLVAPPIPVLSLPAEHGTTIAGTVAVVTSATSGFGETESTMLRAFEAVWVAGALGMAIFQAKRYTRLHKEIRRGRLAPAWLSDELASLSRRLGVTAPRMSVVDGVKMPLLVSGVRPSLLIPSMLLDTLEPSAWRSVLAHELVHVRRRDHWTGWLEFAAACLWWWNPVFWHARRQMRENAEFACDAWVVRLVPEGRREYAESLISVVDTLSWKTLPVGAIGMASGGKRVFERRLEMILRKGVPHRTSPVTLIAIVAAALLTLPTWARSANAATPDTKQSTVSGEVSPVENTTVAELQNVQVGDGISIRNNRAETNKPKPTSTTQDVKKTDAKSVTVQKSTKAVSANKKKAEEKSVKQTAPIVTVHETPPAVVSREVNSASTDNKEFATSAEPAHGILKKSETDAHASTTAPAKRPLLIDDNASSTTGGLQNVQVSGEVRIRFEKYFYH